jgi:hypothetical protein
MNTIPAIHKRVFELIASLPVTAKGKTEFADNFNAVHTAATVDLSKALSVEDGQREIEDTLEGNDSCEWEEMRRPSHPRVRRPPWIRELMGNEKFA